MTEKKYLAENSLSGEAIIVDIITDEMIVRLDGTLFHAQGGGQQSDQGVLGGARVLKATHNGDNVDHQVSSLDGLRVGDKVNISVDEARRVLNARYHTAGHLLAGVVERAFPGVKALQGHQWPGEARVEFGGDLPDKASVENRLQDAINEAVVSDMKVAICGNPYVNRAVQIGDFDAIPCGGTHVSSTSVLGAVHIKGVKVKGDRMKVSYELN